MTRAKVTPPSPSTALPESWAPSNIVDFPRPYIAPAEMAACTRDYAAGYDPLNLDRCSTCGARNPNENQYCSNGFHAPGKTYWPIDEDRAFADAALEMVGEWIFLAAGAVCALIVIVAFLYGKGVL